MGYADPVTGEERLHLDLDASHAPMHVVGAFVFEAGPLADGAGVDIERIRGLVEARLYQVPRYRQHILRAPLDGDPVWVDDGSFNLLYHVRHTHLPHPGDERQLKRLCGQIASQRLDAERPLWELHVVEGLQEERFAIVAKVHQSLARGVWGIGLMEALLGQAPSDVFETGPDWYPRPAPDPADLSRSALRRRLAAPLHFGRTLLEAARNPDALREEASRTLAGLLDPQPASATPFNRSIGLHRRFDWLTLDAAEAERLAAHFKTSLEALGLATLAGAIGRFFEQRGLTPPDQRDLTFRVAAPENPGGLCHGGEPGDTLDWQVLPLPIGEPDPLRRVEALGEAFPEAGHVSYRLFVSASEWLWPGVAGAPARRQLGHGASNLTSACLAGPEAPVYLLGARLLEAYPLLPLVPEQAVRFASFRYGDALHWGISSDWDLMPDLHDLVEAFQDCFRELREAAAVRAA